MIKIPVKYILEHLVTKLPNSETLFQNGTVRSECSNIFLEGGTWECAICISIIYIRPQQQSPGK